MTVVGIPNLVVVALAAVAVALGTWSRLWGTNPVGRITWADAWLKAAMIVVFAIFFVAYLPSRILQTAPVAGLDRTGQDLIGSAAWGVAMFTLIGGLWLTHRHGRV